MAGLDDALRVYQRLGLDTPIFIYHIEGASRYAEPAATILDGVTDSAFEGVASVLTLMELTVKPLRMGQLDIADEYDVLTSNYPHLSVIEINHRAARHAAQLRARYRLRPADALQIAAAIDDGADVFLTNDRDLRRVTEIPVLLLEDFVTA
ncbi:MAG: type II toxin-antitoxin system VapC family toxin [Sphaerobacter sp.]|nr:type II toxin-antitoxin system VapC family toxin [Sphaerobacter sp.]